MEEIKKNIIYNKLKINLDDITTGKQLHIDLRPNFEKVIIVYDDDTIIDMPFSHFTRLIREHYEKTNNGDLNGRA